MKVESLQKRRLSSAIAGVLMASAGAAQAQLEEVVVTATKRSASTQDIPVAVSAMGSETIDQLGVTNFNDFMVQMPGVTAGGAGPGQNTIYIRGVASTTPNLTTAGVAGLQPNVALYLDEQPLAQPGRNLDVYAADINRVEVLKGPQGTLFGSSSQAGTVRMITNKPDPTDTYASVKAGTFFTKGGEMSSNVEGMFNLPVSDSLAVRAVVYTDSQGGYVDNVRGTRDARESARFRTADTVRANGVPVGAFRAGFQAGADLSGVNFLQADNGNRTEDDFNDTVYAGARLSALWDISATWSLTVAHMQQSLESDGVFFSDPELDDYEIARFNEDSLEDDFHNTSWTLEGLVGELEVMYTGAFTDRETEQLVDYSDYLFASQYIPYYICDVTVAYPEAGMAPSGTCQAPDSFTKSSTDTEIWTHEIRVSTPEDRWVRATAGGFYSDMELREVNDFTYPGAELATGIGPFVPAGVPTNGVGFGPNRSAQGASLSDNGLYPEGVLFRNDVLRTDEQYGLFGELSMDLGSQFELTVGARWYDIEVDLLGSAAGSFGNKGSLVDSNGGNNLDELFSAPNPDAAETSGTIGKVSLAWTPNENQLWYATVSEGFRAGLLNRPGGASGNGFTVPFEVDTDDVTNYELGWKIDMLDNTLRFNGSLFLVEIESLQTSIFEPSISNLFFATNAADAEVMGLEGDVTWAPASVQGLVVSGSFSVLDTEITDVLVPTDTVREGDELAFAPEFQATLRARYEWQLASGLDAHVMPYASYSDESFSDIVTVNRDTLDSWLMMGISAGVSSTNWTAEVFVDNITDEQAELSRNFGFDRQRVMLARPLNGGLRVSYNF